MGMSERAEQRLRDRFESVANMARTPMPDLPCWRPKALRRADEILDEYLDYRDHATAWDADRWGLT